MNSSVRTAEAFTKALESAKGADPQTVEAVAKILDPDQRTSDTLWIIFVGSLSAALVLAVAGFIFLLADAKTTDALVTAFSAILAGLLGLFSPSPVNNKGS